MSELTDPPYDTREREMSLTPEHKPQLSSDAELEEIRKDAWECQDLKAAGQILRLLAHIAALTAQNEQLHKQLELGTKEMTVAADNLSEARDTIDHQAADLRAITQKCEEQAATNERLKRQNDQHENEFDAAVKALEAAGVKMADKAGWLDSLAGGVNELAATIERLRADWEEMQRSRDESDACCLRMSEALDENWITHQQLVAKDAEIERLKAERDDWQESSDDWRDLEKGTAEMLAANKCAHCGKPATCHGKYSDHAEGYACDDCCGHGCEDGWCEPIPGRTDGASPSQGVEMKVNLKLLGILIYRGWAIRWDKFNKRFEYRDPKGISGWDYQAENLENLPGPVAEWVLSNVSMENENADHHQA
jgi:hypothetical protein